MPLPKTHASYPGLEARGISRLKYLKNYETINGSSMEIERLSLNPDKFRRVKEIDEKRKMLHLT